MMPPSRILCVVGARPNFMKMAPIVHALAARGGRFDTQLVHTGQHYDEAMSRVFFDELGIPRPHVDLNVGSASHAAQTAAIMAAFEPVLISSAPSLVIVVGDVNSTIACALVGRRSSASRSPTSRPACAASIARCPRRSTGSSPISSRDLLFTTEPDGGENLAREGVPRDACTSSATS